MKKVIKNKKHSQRFTALKAKIDNTQTYPLEEAIKLAKETATTKFDASIDVALRTTIDTKKSDQLVRGTILLPNGSGKKVKIAVIAPPDIQKEAKAAGADIVGGEELIELIAKTKKTDFDILLTVPEMMKDLSKVAKILGPKGLMPNPKTETVTPNIKKAVAELIKGKISYRNDDTGNLHITIGKASFDNTKLLENYRAAMEIINRGKPSSIKGQFIKGVTMSASMGPGIRVQN